MTDTRHIQPRCAICGWPYRKDGCEPLNCSLRPREGSREYVTHVARLAAWDRLVAAGGPAPTKEDVDAELAPKGLPVIDLDGPVWVGPWVNEYPDLWLRWTLRFDDASENPVLTRIDVWRSGNETWRYSSPSRMAKRCSDEGHPTPEAAQEACEAAIIAAWRNR